MKEAAKEFAPLRMPPPSPDQQMVLLLTSIESLLKTLVEQGEAAANARTVASGGQFTKTIDKSELIANLTGSKSKGRK